MSQPDPVSLTPGNPVNTDAGPAPRRRTGRTVTVAIVLGVLLLAASIGGTLVFTTDPSGTATPAVSRSPVDFTFAGDLRQALLSRPEGAVPLEYYGSTSGSISLAQAAGTGKNSNGMLQYLKSLDYRQGAATAWKDSAGNSVYIGLYQFGSDGSAGTWRLGIDNDRSADSDGVFRDINGKWYVYEPSPTNKTGTVRALVQLESVVASISVVTDGAANIALAQQLAKEQYALLPTLGVLPTRSASP